MSNAFRTTTMLSLEQAVGAAPSLAALQARIRDSQRYLGRIQSVLPAALRSQIKAGPVQDGEWCVLVSNASMSAKLRQLSPALLGTLKQHGEEVTAIRIKVQTATR